MQSTWLSVLFIASILFNVQAGPVVERAAATNSHIESIHLRLGVLNEVVWTMESNLAKYVSVCKIEKSAKRLVAMEDELSHESGYLIAGQQIQDICEWMGSHTYSPNTVVNCSTIESSVKTVDDLCEEITLTTTIANKIQPAIKAIKATNSLITNTAMQLSEFATTFSQDLPESVQAVICAPFGC